MVSFSKDTLGGHKMVESLDYGVIMLFPKNPRKEKKVPRTWGKNVQNWHRFAIQKGELARIPDNQALSDGLVNAMVRFVVFDFEKHSDKKVYVFDSLIYSKWLKSSSSGPERTKMFADIDFKLYDYIIGVVNTENHWVIWGTREFSSLLLNDGNANVFLLDLLNREDASTTEELKKFIVGCCQARYSVKVDTLQINVHKPEVVRQSDLINCGFYIIINISPWLWETVKVEKCWLDPKNFLFVKEFIIDHDDLRHRWMTFMAAIGDILNNKQPESPPSIPWACKTPWEGLFDVYTDNRGDFDSSRIVLRASTLSEVGDNSEDVDDHGQMPKQATSGGFLLRSHTLPSSNNPTKRCQISASSDNNHHEVLADR